MTFYLTPIDNCIYSVVEICLFEFITPLKPANLDAISVLIRLLDADRKMVIPAGIYYGVTMASQRIITSQAPRMTSNALILSALWIILKWDTPSCFARDASRLTLNVDIYGGQKYLWHCNDLYVLVMCSSVRDKDAQAGDIQSSMSAV